MRHALSLWTAFQTPCVPEHKAHGLTLGEQGSRGRHVLGEAALWEDVLEGVLPPTWASPAHPELAVPLSLPPTLPRWGFHDVSSPWEEPCEMQIPGCPSTQTPL